MADSNAMSAARAHSQRAGNDSIFVHSIIDGYSFLNWGVVDSYKDGRVDVHFGALKFTDIEVLIPGINGWGIKPVLAAGDKVLLLTTQAPVPVVSDFEASGTMPPYDTSGMKAIPVTTDKTAQLITVSASSLQITGKNKITVDDNGIVIEDVNGNKVAMGKDSMELTFNGGGDIVMDGSFTTINGKLKVKV